MGERGWSDIPGDLLLEEVDLANVSNDAIEDFTLERFFLGVNLREWLERLEGGPLYEKMGELQLPGDYTEE